METIVVGVDGSENGRAALEFAAKEAVLRGARLRIVSAWEIPAAALASVGLSRDFFDEFKDQAVSVVHAAAARLTELQPSVPYEERAMQGQAGNVLLEEALDATLLVVGNRGHGGFRGLLLGSVSRQVLQHARCPVVVVPTVDG
jgi:nucleotide-binding universal stress UspA family protein